MFRIFKKDFLGPRLYFKAQSMLRFLFYKITIVTRVNTTKEYIKVLLNHYNKININNTIRK
jgi:hypothetical protein